MSNFEIVDKRGKNKPEEAVTVEEPILESNGEAYTWKSKVTYLLATMQFQGQLIITGQAAAIRSDGNPFIANYWMVQLQPEDLDWRKYAKERLDTFLFCECISHSQCEFHKKKIATWLETDASRLMAAANQPVPEVVELLVKAAQSRHAAKPNLIPSQKEIQELEHLKRMN